MELQLRDPGIVYALRTQRNMRLHVVAAIAVLVACLLLRIGGFGLIAIVFAVCLVLVTELMNTAIEATVDLATEGLDPLAKIAKDVAAGAVFVASINAVVVAYLVMFEPVRQLAQQGMTWVEVAPASLTVVALGLVSLTVIVLKAASREGSFLHGGWPSGHTALAVGAATALGYITGRAFGIHPRDVHSRPRRTEPSRVRDAHHRSGYPWSDARPADRDRRVSALLHVRLPTAIDLSLV